MMEKTVYPLPDPPPYDSPPQPQIIVVQQRTPRYGDGSLLAPFFTACIISCCVTPILAALTILCWKDKRSKVGTIVGASIGLFLQGLIVIIAAYALKELCIAFSKLPEKSENNDQGLNGTSINRWNSTVTDTISDADFRSSKKRSDCNCCWTLFKATLHCIFETSEEVGNQWPRAQWYVHLQME